MLMETQIQTAQAARPPACKAKTTKEPEAYLVLHAPGDSGPIRIGTLLEPILQIAAHPDRNRLLAAFFSSCTWY